MQNQTQCTFLQRSSYECFYSVTLIKSILKSITLWCHKIVTHTDSHPYPLSVSWPRRRTRCTSLWSTVPVNRLAWYGPSPVWPQATRTTERHTPAHPSSTCASFPDPIGRSGYPSNRSTSVLPLTLRFSVHRINPGWAEGSGPGSGPSLSTHSRVGARQRRKKMKD